VSEYRDPFEMLEERLARSGRLGDKAIRLYRQGRISSEALLRVALFMRRTLRQADELLGLEPDEDEEDL
jgi:hypothetical protein